MHPHLIDWFRSTHIHSDAKVIEQRWNTAQEFSKKLTRENAISLLRLFLFENPKMDLVKQITDVLLTMDKEFPVGNNTEELRLMAGVIMVAAFSERSLLANVFAIGLSAASFPSGRASPIQPAIMAEARKYLIEEAEKERPADFIAEPIDFEETLLAKHKALSEAEAAADAAKISNARATFNKALIKALKEVNNCHHSQIRRLSEETDLLWWVLSESCFTLKSRTNDLTVVGFALIAAAEAAQRTHVLPPPVSMDALLRRALAPCKTKSKGHFLLQDYLGGLDISFRDAQLTKMFFADCTDLLPISAALAKYQEFGEVTPAINVIPNICPGFKVDKEILPIDASLQFYNEIMFLKALALLKT
jgi:hypothetical protein